MKARPWTNSLERWGISHEKGGRSRGSHFNVGGFKALAALPGEHGKPPFQRTLAQRWAVNVSNVRGKTDLTLRFNVLERG